MLPLKTMPGLLISKQGDTQQFNLNLPAWEASSEVSNSIKRKNTHPAVYCVKYVSVCDNCLGASMIFDLVNVQLLLKRLS